MKEILTLKHPIMVNNVEIKELSYDAEEITAAQFAEAEARRKTAAGKNAGISPVAEVDVGLQLYMGFAAIIAVNGMLHYAALERMHGADVVAVMKIGRDFLLGSAASPAASSDGQSGTTPAPILPVPRNSNGKE